MQDPDINIAAHRKASLIEFAKEGEPSVDRWADSHTPDKPA
jgi:hypothetical protein